MKNNIKTLRKQKGFTQIYLAERLGVTIWHLNRVENGKGQLSLDKSFKLAKILGVTVDELYM